MNKVIEQVFPSGNFSGKEYVEDGDIPPITRDELSTAVRGLGKKKSPGPDSIPAEYVAVMFNVDPQCLLRIFNEMLLWERIPECWKVARLVLLRKDGEEGQTPQDIDRFVGPM